MCRASSQRAVVNKPPAPQKMLIIPFITILFKDGSSQTYTRSVNDMFCYNCGAALPEMLNSALTVERP